MSITENTTSPFNRQLPRPRVENAPGLAWKLRQGYWEARWQARSDIVDRGYKIKSFKLWSGLRPTKEEAETISQKCRELQAEMHAWSKTELPALPTRRYAGGGSIYFVSDGIGIKIGFSENFSDRFDNLRAANRAELTVLALVPGTRADEKRLHDRFAHLHIRGEWHAQVAELLTFIDEAKAKI